MPTRLVSRIIAGASSPLALIALILFFVPWVNITCNDMKLASASGLQLTIGDVSPVPAMDGRNSIKDSDDDDGPKARPWFVMGLIVPLGLLGTCAAMLAGKLGLARGGTLLAAVALVGLIVMILAANVDYQDEMMKDKPAQDASSPISPEQVAAMIGTRATGALWVSLAFYIIIILLGVAAVFFPWAKVQLAASAPALRQGEEGNA